MNRLTKISLSVMIVSLSALVVPLKGQDKDVQTKSVAVQEIEVSTEICCQTAHCGRC